MINATRRSRSVASMNSFWRFGRVYFCNFRCKLNGIRGSYLRLILVHIVKWLVYNRKNTSAGSLLRTVLDRKNGTEMGRRSDPSFVDFAWYRHLSSMNLIFLNSLASSGKIDILIYLWSLILQIEIVTIYDHVSVTTKKTLVNRCGQTQPFYNIDIDGNVSPNMSSRVAKQKSLPRKPNIQETLDNMIVVGLHCNAPDVEAGLLNLFGVNFWPYYLKEFHKWHLKDGMMDRLVDHLVDHLVNHLVDYLRFLKRRSIHIQIYQFVS